MTTVPEPTPGPNGPSDRRHATCADGPSGSDAPNASPLEPLVKHLAELREFALNYLEARKDQAKASAHRLLMRLALICVAGVSLFAMLFVSMILVMTGLSQVIGDALGGRAGVGQLVVGGGAILTILAVFPIKIAVKNRRALQETTRKYVRRHHDQRSRFGKDVAQRASS